MKSLSILPAAPPRAPAVPASAAVSGAAPAPTLAPWRAAWLRVAPHRLGFFAGGVLLAASGLWWAIALATRYAGVSLPWAVAPPVAHGLAMGLSFMPLFMVGFLFTAGPKWLAMPDVPASSLLRPVLAMSLGWGVALVGFHISALLAGLGMGVAAWGWAQLMLRFGRLVQASPALDKLHARSVLVAGGVGVLAMASGALAVALEAVPWARAAAQLALWGFLALVFAVVSHRMLPFFTASALPLHQAWRPSWVLWVMNAALAATAVGASLEALTGSLPLAARAAMLAVQAPAALFVLWLAFRWGLWPSRRVRLLVMLHAGFAWLGVALALAALANARELLSGQAGGLGLAPLHALTMGFLGAMLLAMITRVTAGHGGRPLLADNLAWSLYLLLQTAAVLRVGAALWPDGEVALTLLAAAAWAAACTGWALRYGNWLGRPRADGRPG